MIIDFSRSFRKQEQTTLISSAEVVKVTNIFKIITALL